MQLATPNQTSKKKVKKRRIKKTPDKTRRPQPINETPGPSPTDMNIVAQPVALGDDGVKSLRKIKGFFAQYPGFQYRPANSSVIEFNRLCKEYHWKRHDNEREAARNGFDLAMKQEFATLYGSDEKDINNWYKLCHILKIDPVPKALGSCRAVRS
jgi:hypothetical protein